MRKMMGLGFLRTFPGRKGFTSIVGITGTIGAGWCFSMDSAHATYAGPAL